MRKFGILAIVFAMAIGLNSFVNKGEEYSTLKIGDKAPQTISKEMKSANGKMLSVESAASSNGTLIIFSCNTCPFVIAWEDRYPELKELADEYEIGFVLVNSNEAKRSGEDSIEKMLAHAKEKGYSNIPYLVDVNSEMANSFGAKTTPHVFLFDKNWTLVYEGAIDDNHKDASSVDQAYLKNAIKNLAQGKEIDPNDTKALGCSIKRV